LGIYLYNKDEIKKIQEACIITANILDEIEDIIEEGISTYEVDRYTRTLVKRYNVQAAFLGYQGFPGALCTSINEVVVHGIPNKRDILKVGDIVGIDFGVCLDGYYGDSARSYPVGNIDDKARQLLKVTRDALYQGISKAKIGNRISDISHAIEAYVNEYGFTSVQEFVGHGIGKSLHEEPSVPNYGTPGRGPRIKEGMVFAIEPMINAGASDVEVLNDAWTVVTLDRKLSAHFEHTIAIIEGTAVILTKGRDFK
jgi:methionyl aminopeptidase